ncbi:MAG: tetratricopeptide repeat protein [Parachlamydia sp.]|jgi:tetratricopeptide (TPR) repeat protein|nr:tetratricopeptide repeat protein [Parachlamydia sp.]
MKLKTAFCILFAFAIGLFFVGQADTVQAEILPTKKSDRDDRLQAILENYQGELEKDPNNLTLLRAVGDGYYSLQNYKQAEKYFTQALALDPTNNDIKISVANTYLNTNQLQKSEEIFQSMPGHPSSLAGLGQIALKRGKLELAGELLAKALQIEPDNISAQFYLAELNIEQKDYKEAEDLLVRLNEEYPNEKWISDALIRASVGPSLEKGRSLLEKGNAREALEIYEEALKQFPNNIEILIAIANSYSKEGEYAQALAILQKGLQANPDNPSLQIASGFAYLSLKDEWSAGSLFYQVDEREGGNAEAKAGLGRLEEIKGNYREAESFYNQALKINPSDPLALSYLAHLKTKQKKYSEALQLYEKIQVIEPKSSWVASAIQEARSAPVLDAIHELKKNNPQPNSQAFKQIIRHFQKLIRNYPNDAFNYLEFARFYDDFGMNKNAIRVLSEGLSKNPHSLELQLALGQAYLLGKKLAKAEKIFQLVLEKEPQNSEALLGLGRVQALNGNDKLSASFYEKVLSKTPSDMTALAYYSDLSYRQKNYPLSAELYQRILQSHPQLNWAEQGFLRAKYGLQMEDIIRAEKEGHLDEAERGYQDILKQSPQFEDAYLRLGQLYASQGNEKAAIRLYAKKLKENPKSVELKIRLSLADLQKGKMKRAKRLLQEAYKEAPGNPETLAALGRLAALQGHADQAESLFKKALEIDPNRLLTLSYYAIFLMDQKQFTQAAAVYQQLLTIEPQALWAHEGLENARFGPTLLDIEASEQSKDYSRAESMYLALIHEAPKRADFYIKLGQLYSKTKQYSQAIAIYKKGLETLPESYELKTALGIVLLEAGKRQQGKRLLQAVLKKNPRNSEAIAGLGYYYQLKGEPVQAEGYYAKSLEIRADQLTALSFLSRLLTQQRRYDEAKDILLRIQKIDPSAAWTTLAIEDAVHGPLLDQIQSAEERKDNKVAEMLWNQLLTASPQVSPYYLRVGFFYQRLLEYDKAIDVFSRGLKIDPTSADLYAALGLAYLSKKEYPAARENFENALKLDPLSPDALAGLGYVEYIYQHYSLAKDLMRKALSIDPNRPAALSAMGELLMKLKEYPEAVQVYERLLYLSPHEEWIQLALEDAKNGPLLDRIERLVKEEQYSKAADLYEEILQRSPGHPRYYYGLGYMYIKLKEYAHAIPIYSEGLGINPESNELRVALGYAYLFNKDLMEAEEVLQQSVEKDAKNPEALAGLGRVLALKGDYCAAEHLFIRAISSDPKNLSALTFYGDLLLKQKRYEEAQELFAIISQLLPDAVWVQRAWQDSQDGPLMDLASRYADREDFELARDLYCRLLQLSPDDPARYLPLGQMYVNLQRYFAAIDVYMQGIALDPEAWYLWRALGFAYIYLEEFEKSRCIFLSLLDNDPEDAESWAGLGRIEALDGSLCRAHDYYDSALLLSPNNLTALSFLADLYQFEHYYFSSLELYDEMIRVVEEGHEAAGGCGHPKWLKRGYNNILNLTLPTLSVKASYYEEDQWDSTVHRWSARYAVYGGTALINYPFLNNLSLWGSVTDQFYELKDLLDDRYLYSFDVQRFYIGANWVLSPCFEIDAQAGMTMYSPYRCSSFKSLRGTIGELSVNFIYRQPIERATIGFFTRSDLVARDFDTNQAKIVPYYFIEGTYDRKIYRRTWVGLIADYYWYDDFAHNRGQRALAWIQWRPPCYSDNILFRYHFKYQSYDKNIPDYYTYKPQLINHLQMTLEKYWRVCWADTFYTNVSFAHGWQDTHTRFAQNIVIGPDIAALPLTNDPCISSNAFLPPMKWDHRQYNLITGTLIYKCNQLQAILNADYYRDTEKYTIWSVGAEVIWRF